VGTLIVWHAAVFAVTYGNGGQQAGAVQLLDKLEDQATRVRL